MHLLLKTLYTALFYLAIPLILLRLWWRGRKSPGYRRRWAERFGYYPAGAMDTDIWFHAVSVGEAEALFPLVRRCLKEHPGARLVITCTTPTGSARIQSVLQDSVAHVYLPYDIPDAVNRFLNHFQPKLAVIMETELWPNLLAGCQHKAIPVYVINARLSEKSARGYKKLSSLLSPILVEVQLIAAQTQHDAARFIGIGANPARVKILGNIKFDIEIPEAVQMEGKVLKDRLFKQRFVWLLGSTHPQEEALILQVYQQLKQDIPELLLLIVPRHPERFDEVEKLCREQGLIVLRRTAPQSPPQAIDIYLADTMGELKMLYAAADVAFVGGSLVPIGGHNVLEAAAAGVPVMFGPYMSNFKEIAAGILTHKAALQCQDAKELAAQLLELYQNPVLRNQLTVQARLFLQANRGALDKIYSILEETIWL